jgi:hypothetical protein
MGLIGLAIGSISLLAIKEPKRAEKEDVLIDE